MAKYLAQKNTFHIPVTLGLNLGFIVESNVSIVVFKSAPIDFLQIQRSYWGEKTEGGIGKAQLFLPVLDPNITTCQAFCYLCLDDVTAVTI